MDIGLSGLFSSGLNLTAQFVGSYYWNMSLSGGFEASPALQR